MNPSEVLRLAQDIHNDGQSALTSLALAAGGNGAAGMIALYFWRKADKDFYRAIALAEAEE